MQKQRIVEVEQVDNHIIAFPASRARPELKLAKSDPSDVSAVGPARQLQNDLARAFAADAGWSVKRTVIVACVSYGAVLAALLLAASNLIPHIGR